MRDFKEFEKKVKKAKNVKELLEFVEEMGDHEKMLFYKELSRRAKEEPELQKKLEEKGIKL